VVDTSLDEELKFLAICPLQYAETANIERLGEVRGMGRETEGNNGVVFVELLELGREVAFIAVEDKHAICTFPLGVYRLIEVLNLI